MTACYLKSNRWFFLCLMAGSLALWLTPVQARDFQLVVSGLGGSPDYTERFSKAFDDIVAAFSGDTKDATLNDTPVTLRALSSTASTREAMLAQLADLATTLTEDDSLLVMLLGHGTYDGEHYKFNVQGPDLTGQDLKRALADVKATRQLVVLATSASGVMLKTLEQEGRVVITATKSGGEINGVTFPVYWAQAMASDVADIDRNEIVTAEEAFRFTENQVASYYTDEGLLATEHARLEGDNAAGLPIMRIGALRDSLGNPVVEALLADRTTLELELTQLRRQKDDLTRDAYFDQLEVLMLRMAKLQQSIDDATGWSEQGE